MVPQGFSLKYTGVRDSSAWQGGEDMSFDLREAFPESTILLFERYAGQPALAGLTHGFDDQVRLPLNGRRMVGRLSGDASHVIRSDSLLSFLNLMKGVKSRTESQLPKGRRATAKFTDEKILGAVCGYASPTHCRGLRLFILIAFERPRRKLLWGKRCVGVV